MRISNCCCSLSICHFLLLCLFLNFFRGLESQGNEICKNKLDIFFLIDGSGSLGEEDFFRSKDLVSQILSMYNIPDRNRAGYAVFTASINNVRYLTPDISNLLVHLEYEQYPATRTDLFNALRFVYEDVFKHGNTRANTDRALVVLTDGSDERDLIELARKLEAERGVRIIVFGFGDNLDQDQLENIATDPDTANLFMFTSLSDGITSIQMLGNAICPAPECCGRGKQGKRGARGIDGQQGERGDQGKTGTCRIRNRECTLRLRKGEKGFMGETGQQGVIGPKGKKGFVGEKGLRGDQGVQGLRGNNGSKGSKGEMEVNGTKGETGVQGVIGDKGMIGVDGENGEKGIKGSKSGVGPIGVCRNSTFSTNSSCKGVKGDMGVTGPSGLKGIIGLKGINGSEGQKGDKGNTGLKGDFGPQGNLGDEGVRGDAIRYQEQIPNNCSEPGSLFFDKSKKLLYYCDGKNLTYKCIGAGPTGSCTDCKCELEEGKVIQCNSAQLISETDSSCTPNVAVDFVLIVDDSSDNVKSQQWLRKYIPILNQRLLDKCIGQSTLAPNLAQLIGFGADAFLQPPHFVTATSPFLFPGMSGFDNPTMKLNELENAIDLLYGKLLVGFNEPGYAALQFALDHAILRQSTQETQYVPFFIFISDEHSIDYSESKFEEILERFRQLPSSILEFIVNPLSFNTSGIENIFGVSYSNSQYLNVWRYNDTHTDTVIVPSGSVEVYPRDDPMHRAIKREYIDLAMCTQRASTHVWNMASFLAEDDRIVEKVSNAFLVESINTIEEQGVKFSCQQCYCNRTGNSNCIQLEGKILCDCLSSSMDRRCPCVRQQVQNLLEGRSNMTIPMVRLTCGIDSPRVEIDECREFLVVPTVSS